MSKLFAILLTAVALTACSDDPKPEPELPPVLTEQQVDSCLQEYLSAVIHAGYLGWYRPSEKRMIHGMEDVKPGDIQLRIRHRPRGTHYSVLVSIEAGSRPVRAVEYRVRNDRWLPWCVYGFPD